MIHLSSRQQLVQQPALALTTQLQQAIGLLRMGNQELASVALELAERNPFLEVQIPEAEPPAPRMPSPDVSAFAGTLPDNLAAPSKPSLYAHVCAAIPTLVADPADHPLALAMCEALDPSGWLSEPLTSIAARTGNPVERAERILTALQRIEPAGLFARNLGECLDLQIERAAHDNRQAPCPVLKTLIGDLPALAAGKFDVLCRRAGCSRKALDSAMRRLRSLDPKPGAAFADDPVPYRATPELIAVRQDGGWRVSLNDAGLPVVRVTAPPVSDGPDRGTRRKDSADQAFVRDALSSARWLERAIARRNQTILSIGDQIVAQQARFLTDGVDHLRPMRMKAVAEAAGVHESTVSRVASGVRMAVPWGLVPLRLFFSGGLGGSSGGGPEGGEADQGVSTRAVQNKVRRIIQAEDPARPLSDDAIARIIAADGPTVARRTVAKYRENAGIASSAGRRRAYRLASV